MVVSFRKAVLGRCGAVYDIRMRIVALDPAATPLHVLSAAVRR
jgi:hypothetical protein